MRALWFLTTRQIINGVKRAVRSPRRLIGLLFMILIYANGPIQSLFWGNRSRGRNNSLQSATQNISDKLVIEPSLIVGSIFLIFSGLFMFNSMGLLAYRATFKPADVDVLFPTPISPKLMLGVKMIRDTFLSLLLPFILLLMGGSSAFLALRKSTTTNSINGILTAVTLAIPMYLLMSAVFISFGYGVGLYLSRPNLKSEYETRIIGWSLAILNSCFIGYVAYLFVNAQSFQAGVQAFSTPVNKLLFFPAWGATQVIGLGAGTSQAGAFLAIVGFIMAIVFSVLFAMGKSKLLLEISAMRAAEMGELMSVVKSGNSSAIFAYRARKGKVKVKRSSFLERTRWKGPWALVWRELVISYRMGLKISLVTPFLLLIVVIGFKYFGNLPPRAASMMGWASVAGITYTSLIAALAQRTLIDLLKRCDTIKPLPFNSSTTIYFELFARCAPQLISIVSAFLLGAVIFNQQWEAHIAGVILMPPLIVLLIVTQMLIMIIFPDYDDVTQKGFAGVMQLLGMAVVIAVPAGIFAVSFLLIKAGIIASSIFSTIAMILISFLVASIAARLYEGFNPSD